MRVKKILKSRKGLTLVELIISIVILAIIALAIAWLMVPMMNVFDRNNTLSEMNAILDDSAKELENALSRAQRANVSGTRLEVVSNNQQDVYDLDQGILQKNGRNLVADGYYRDATLQVAYLDPDTGAALDGPITSGVVMRISAAIDGQVQMERDYAVSPMGLNQYNRNG